MAEPKVRAIAGTVPVLHTGNSLYLTMGGGDFKQRASRATSGST